MRFHSSAAAWLLSMLCTSPALAQTTWGPWTFEDDRPFADGVRSVGAPLDSAQGDVSDLVGNNLGGCIINLGYPCWRGAQILELSFTDMPVENREGHDLVIFDAPYSINEYEVAVQPIEGPLTEYRVFRPTVDTDRSACVASVTLRGVAIDLSDFGLPDGTRLEAVRIKGDCATNPQTQSDGSELDLAMAAALQGANRCAATTCAHPASDPEDPELPERQCSRDSDCGELLFCDALGQCSVQGGDGGAVAVGCDAGGCDAAPPTSACDPGDATCRDAAGTFDAAASAPDGGLVAPFPGPRAGCSCQLARGERRRQLGWVWWPLLGLFLVRRGRGGSHVVARQ